MLNNFCFHVYAQKSQVVRLSRCQFVKFEPWNMLNKFCFHLYAQKLLIIDENGNDFFLTSTSPSPVSLEVIELVPS